MPGGVTGSPNLIKCKLVGELLRKHDAKGKLIGAICMSPTVLLANDIALGKRITSYPKTKDELSKKYEYCEESVVQDGNIITSRGPGTVWRFTLKVVENLCGIEETKRVAEVNLLNEFLDKTIN
jgi:protein DJ-1